MQNHRGRGQHGKKGESKSLIILEILKMNFNMINKEKIITLYKHGFMPVKREELKSELKYDFEITKKNADALIRSLLKEKVIKEKNADIHLNYKKNERFAAIMDVLSNSNYNLSLIYRDSEMKALIEKTNGKPFLNAINKAFCECFISVYGDIPFPPEVQTGMPKTHDKWVKFTVNAIKEGKRPNLTNNQVEEILAIAEKIRGKLTTKFKIMYILRVSYMIRVYKNNDLILKIPFTMLSLREYPRLFIEEWEMDNKTKGMVNKTSLIISCFIAIMDIAYNPEGVYLDQDINKYEKTILEANMIWKLGGWAPFQNILELYKHEPDFFTITMKLHNEMKFNEFLNYLDSKKGRKYIHDLLKKGGEKIRNHIY